MTIMKLLVVLTVPIYMLVKLGNFNMDHVAIIILRIVRQADLELVTLQWRHPVVVFRIADIFSFNAEHNKLDIKIKE